MPIDLATYRSMIGWWHARMQPRPTATPATIRPHLFSVSQAHGSLFNEKTFGAGFVVPFTTFDAPRHAYSLTILAYGRCKKWGFK